MVPKIHIKHWPISCCNTRTSYGTVIFPRNRIKCWFHKSHLYHNGQALTSRSSIWCGINNYDKSNNTDGLQWSFQVSRIVAGRLMRNAITVWMTNNKNWRISLLQTPVLATVSIVGGHEKNDRTSYRNSKYYNQSIDLNIQINIYHVCRIHISMSHYSICEQGVVRPGWAKARSDLGICCLHTQNVSCLF